MTRRADHASLFSASIEVETDGIGFYELTSQVDGAIERSGFDAGLAVLFVHHTSASLLIQEGADPSVLNDLQRFFARLVPEGDPAYTHTLEGADDMPSHIRSMLTHTSEVIPFESARLALGRWQQIFLFEHRRAGRRRCVSIRLLGSRVESGPGASGA